MLNLIKLMKMYKFFTAVIGAVAVLLAVSVSGCSNKNETKQIRQEKTEAPAVKPAQNGDKLAKAVKAPDRPKLEVVSRKVTLTWEEAGKVKMKASAAEIVGNELSGTGTMKDARVLWYDNGQLTTVMDAPRIDAEQSTQTLTASGGVTVKSIPRKTVVKARWLKWLAKDHKVIGNGGVTVTSDVGTVEAAGLEADTELKALKFTSTGNDGSASFSPQR